MSLFDKQMQKEKFGELAVQEEKRLYSLCFYMLHNRADAEDCAQEAILKAYTHIGRLKDEKGFAPWITRIAINCCRDLLRKKHRTFLSLEGLEEQGKTIPDEGPDAYLQLEKAERQRLLREALKILPAQDREILILRDIQGRDYREIGVILRLREGTVKSRLNRARNKLKAVLQNETELFPDRRVI